MNNAAFIEAQASYVAAAIAADVPPPDIRCCFNCRAWKVRDWPHCQSSGPWGGKHAVEACASATGQHRVIAHFVNKTHLANEAMEAVSSVAAEVRA